MTNGVRRIRRPTAKARQITNKKSPPTLIDGTEPTGRGVTYVALSSCHVRAFGTTRQGTRNPSELDFVELRIRTVTRECGAAKFHST